jgi:hypothetical protein
VFSKGTNGIIGKISKSVDCVKTGLPLVVNAKRKIKLHGKPKEVIAKLGGKRWKLDGVEWLKVNQVDKDNKPVGEGKGLGQGGVGDVKNYPYSMLYKICNKDSEQRMSLNEFDNYCSFVKTKLFL